MMEVVATGERAGGGQHPFQRRNVQEWSRLDELTGMLEHARVETDHWAASTSNSSHHFGKVVDSRSRNLADGGKEQRQQTKQLEVFQANIPGGSLQVIRSQSVTSTSSSWHGQHKISSSRWNSNNNEVPTLPSIQNKEFDNLKLALNPLDLSSQKTKASVGRSGSIGSRRPPSRPRSIVSLKHDDITSEDKEANRLSELSRITHQIHQEAKEKLFSNLETTSMHRHLSNGLNRTKYDYDENDTNDFPYSLEGRCNVRNSSVHEIAKSSSESTISSSHHSLTRKKSCSSEDLHHNEEDKKTDDIGSDKLEWNRSSKVRRSLQFPLKPNTVQKEIPVVPLTKSVSQIKEEIEARKQIVSSALKGNQWNNLGELEGVLGVVSNGHDGEPIPPSSPKKRQSFITVESLKEVRGRLRKLSTSTDDAIRSEEPDDGIVTEVKSNSPVLDKIEDTSKNSVKSYVFGMETVLRSAKPVLGTGSLESRSSNKTNGNGNNRTEEWYNRRKSYGFEQVNGQQSNHSNMPIEKSKVDSSTDSGICRSSETMAFPSWVKPMVIDRSDTDDGNKLKTSHSIVIKQFENENERHINKEKFKSEIESGTVIPTGRKTVVTLGSNNYSQSNWNWNTNNEETQNNNDDKKETVTKGKIADALRKLREKSTSFESHRLSEPITITIPIQHSHPQITDPKLLLLKQTKETEKSEVTPSASLKGQNMTSYSHLLYGHNTNENDTDLSNENIKENGDILRGQTNRTKTLSNWFDSELKRHSIAVDDAKYITNRSKSYGSNYFQENHDRKISLPTNNDMKENPGQVNNTSGHLFLNSGEKDPNKYSGESDYELNSHEKKQKRVEFCKTEVHFAAEPGRFNIVETDGKPPPSNMYRRRKKTITETTNRTGLPEIRFGDSQYEKHLLTSNENNEFDSDPKVKPLTFRGSPVFQDGEKEDIVTFAQNNTTATSSCTYLSDSSQEEQKIIEPQIYSEDETPRPRSILKNNIPKPRPFLLGENDNIQEPLWGVKLKSVNENDKVIEVTSNDNDNIPITTKETEFQKLLRSLRPATHKSSDFERSLVESSSIAADNGLEVRISSSTALPDQRRASWSVADRIRHVEDLRTKGYLTKVNFGIGEAVVIGSKTEEQPKISCYESDTPNSWYKREQHFAKDAVVSTSNNRVLPFVPQVSHAQGIETTFNNRPKVTSISLNYEKPMTQLPVTIFSQPTQQTTNTVKTTSDLEIIGNVEQSENGTRIWSFSKSSSSPIERKSPLKPTNDNYSLQKSEQKITSQTLKVEHLDETNTNIEIRPSHLSNRKPLSPSKDILLVQKAEDKNVKLSDTNRHCSLSPSIPLKRSQKKYNEDSAEKTSQTEPEYVNIKKDVKATQTSYRQISNSQAYNRSTRDKIKKDSIKSNECNKLVNDSKRKERKLSTSSSGRDGWLNTPKEPQARQKSDTHHRKVEVKKENNLSTNVIKQNNVKRIQNGSESPIYQNREVYAVKKDATDRSETESAILEELTKAADQILLAVNGYTDDDSFKGSSDDEYRKRHGREKIISKPLCTISETPNKKITNTNYRRTSQITTQRTRTAEIHKDQRAVPKPRITKTSSNSSMDSGPPEVRPLLTSEDRSKRRAARLLQRANSRELLLQTGASSSEDIGSGSEAGNVRTKQRIVRRTRAQGTRSSTSTQQTAISHRSTTTASESRTRERVQRSIANSDKTSSKKQVISRRTKGDEKLSNHLRPITGSAGPVKCERAERRSLTMSSSLQPSNVSSKKKSYTSQSEESTKSRE